ncbi:hypothetical protein QVD17_38849 [Tagetes erecta]|uniref:PWWP domain-containing protein n=1 Tax=Tagetes erecta TaxID=13708 RepID=A0AAD8N9Q5_TARER|nr:hypothetical protein QVD17_38849 [Tagetes erecta]
METLETSETLIEGLVGSKQDEIGNQFGGTVARSFNLGEMKCVDSCKVKGSDSSSNGDVGMKGISLFVELKGGLANKPDGESVRDVGNGLLCENRVKVDVGQQEPKVNVGDFVELTGGVANKPDGESIRDVGNSLLYENRVKVDVGQQEHEVNVGEFVWAMVHKNLKHTWWPGIVCDAANAPKDVANRLSREDDVLVRCFGNGDLIWCSLYEVKPFVGHFDQLPNQSNAKKFLVALGEALTVLGQRIKAEFTCSCLSNVQKERTSNFGDLLVARFEPSVFLDYVKDLGKSNLMPDMMEYVVKHNCLSAFYRSLGHLQIPMDQLAPANGTPLKIKTEEKNGYFGNDIEKRERKKSMFLTFSGECGIGESNVYGQSQPVKKPVKKTVKKWSRKNKAVQAKLCSSEVLSQLHFAAKDCLFVCESKNFDSVKWFISGFRKLAFSDPNDKPVISPALGNNLNHGPMFLDFQNVGSLNLEAQSMANNRTEWPANQPLTKPPLSKLEPKRRKKIAENITARNTDIHILPKVNHMEGLYPASAYNFPNGFGSTPPYFTGYYGQPQVGPVPTGLGRVLKKRGRKKKNIDLQADPGSTIDLQANPGSTTGLQANPASTTGLQANLGPPTGLQAYPAHPTMGLQAYPAHPAMGLQSYPAHPRMGPHAYPAHPSVGAHAYPAHPTMGLQAYPPHPAMGPQAYPTHPAMGLQAYPGDPAMGSQAYPGHPSMGLQANPCHPAMGSQAYPGHQAMGLQANSGSTVALQANPSSAIVPYLNEDIIGQKKPKKVKRSKEVGIPCINLSYTKVQQDNLEVKGSAFLLKFSSDHPLPTNQDLNSAFSKFGELIESETLVSNENLSGQVVFLDSSSAGGAFWGLQNDKPLGPALVNYKVQHLAGSESTVQFKTSLKSPSGPKPMDSNTIINPSMIPDLNTNSTEVQIMKRSKTIEEIRLPSSDNHLSYSKVHQSNEEVTGTALLLKFSPNHPLPSSQDLNLVFCKYGELNESETRVYGQDFTGQVVFVNPSTAGDAIHKLEKDQPFGSALLSYRIQHLYCVQSAVQAKKPVNVSLDVKSPQDPMALKTVRTENSVNVSLDVKPPQDLVALKKNLEMMNYMLEKSGDSLSPEMRGKLESEIKGLMNKVSAMDGSSSSCL